MNPSPDALPHAVTSVLAQWYGGDQEAFEQLLTITYRDLKAVAAKALRGEGRENSLQPTLLINEIYLRLQANPQMHFENRARFFAFAGKLMRQYLVDYSRARYAAKRGGYQAPLALDDVEAVLSDASLDIASVLSVDNALKKLEEEDPRKAQIVELRFFAGMTVEEICDALTLSKSTVLREWRLARFFLMRELGRPDGNP